MKHYKKCMEMEENVKQYKKCMEMEECETL